MPIPVATRQVHADIRDADGAPASGSVEFIQRHWLYDETGNVVLAPGSYTGALTDGAVTVEVPATDAPGVTPTGRTVAVRIITAGQRHYYDIEIPTGSGVLELADLPPVASAGEPVTYATAAALATLDAEVDAHTADTTGVHGIADTAALVATTDPRLTNARTPTAHAASHAAAGADPVTPAAIGAYPATGGTLAGPLILSDQNGTFIRADGTGGYRVRTTDGAEGFADYDYVGQLVVWVWSGPNFTGSQTGRQRWHGAGTTFAGITSFGSSVFAGEQFVHGTDLYACLGGKNGASPVNICGRTATPGAPSTGTWAAGDLIYDSAGEPHLCTAGGTPGTWT
jgi:hypothetical protein